jgi:hypothetical protein
MHSLTTRFEEEVIVIDQANVALKPQACSVQLKGSRGLNYFQIQYFSIQTYITLSYLKIN